MVTETAGAADNGLTAPDLKRYVAYRPFLRDWFAHKKALRPGFSYRRFSAMLGLKSPNFLQLVIVGERNLSPLLAAKLCRQLRFTPHERNYFLSLVRLDSAKTSRDKDEAEKWRRISLRKMLTTPMTILHERIFARWYHMLVRELVFLPDFEFSGEYVARRLSGLITADEGEESLQLLLKAGFISREGDRYRATSSVLDSGDGIFTHQLMQRQHAETLTAWGKNLPKLRADDQELGLLHIPLNGNKIPELKARIRRFQDEIIGWLESEENPDRLAQLGTYLISFAQRERDH